MNSHSTYAHHMIQRAEAFAAAAHEAVRQTRQYSDEPYIVHPRAVAQIVKALPGHTWAQIVLAWLHDVVEDTGVSLATINDFFSGEIGQGVYYLTNCEKDRGNRKERHAINIERLASAPDWVQTVKFADIKDNTKDIVDLNPGFARQYLDEKVAVLCAMKGGDRVLWSMVMDQLVAQTHRLRELAHA